MTNSKQLQSLRIAAALLALCAAGGCARDSVVFGTSTRLALEVAGPADSQVRINLGFRRQEGVTMPLFDERRTYRWGDGIQDARQDPWACEVWIVGDLLCRVSYRERRHTGYATLSAMRLDTGALLPTNLRNDRLSIGQLFATGSAAAHPKSARTAALLLASGSPGADGGAANALRAKVKAADDAGTKARKITARCLGATKQEPTTEEAVAMIDVAEKHPFGVGRIREALAEIAANTTPEQACPSPT